MTAGRASTLARGMILVDTNVLLRMSRQPHSGAFRRTCHRPAIYGGFCAWKTSIEPGSRETFCDVWSYVATIVGQSQLFLRELELG